MGILQKKGVKIRITTATYHYQQIELDEYGYRKCSKNHIRVE